MYSFKEDSELHITENAQTLSPLYVYFPFLSVGTAGVD